MKFRAVTTALLILILWFSVASYVQLTSIGKTVSRHLDVDVGSIWSQVLDNERGINKVVRLIENEQLEHGNIYRLLEQVNRNTR